MVTIHRHPVPTDSYDPKRPLNDLLIAQFEHFKHIAEMLPADVRSGIPAAPSLDDREGVDRFVAAITRDQVSRKKEKLRLVKPTRRKQPGTLDIAAAAEEKPKRSKAAKSKANAGQGSVAGPKQ